MKTEWTKQELQTAIDEIDGNDTAGMLWRDVAIGLACQRNRMIAAAKDAKERLACEDIAGAYKILNLAIAACAEGK